MYSRLSIDELVERCQETSGEEGNALKREAARRFREGIGVDVDMVEADYWESQIERSATSEFEPEISVQETDKFTPAEEPVIADYENMDARALYRAYRTGDSWAVYYFALHMKENGEGKNALAELESLAITLERALEESNMSKDTMQMLSLVKLQMGRLYENLDENPDSMQKALACYEEAVLELGCAEAVPDLLRFYAADDIAVHEKQIFPLLSKKEEGSVEDRMFVAELYREMGRNVFAMAVYEELLEQKSLPVDIAATVMKRLVDLGAMNEADLLHRSQGGDAAATFALAQVRYWDGDYREAQELFELCMNQNNQFGERCKQELMKVEERQLEIRTKQETETAQRRAEEKKNMARQAEQEREDEEKKAKMEVKSRTKVLFKRTAMRLFLWWILISAANFVFIKTLQDAAVIIFIWEVLSICIFALLIALPLYNVFADRRGSNQGNGTLTENTWRILDEDDEDDEPETVSRETIAIQNSYIADINACLSDTIYSWRWANKSTVSTIFIYASLNRDDYGIGSLTVKNGRVEQVCYEDREGNHKIFTNTALVEFWQAERTRMEAPVVEFMKRMIPDAKWSWVNIEEGTITVTSIDKGILDCTAKLKRTPDGEVSSILVQTGENEFRRYYAKETAKAGGAAV